MSPSFVPAGSRPATDLNAALAAIPFADGERSRVHLLHAIEQVSAALGTMLPGLIAEAADPDSAILLFDRLLSEAGEDTKSLLEQNHFLAHYAVVVFGHSRYLGETLLQNPDFLGSFLQDKSIARGFSREDFQEELTGFRWRYPEAHTSLLLARFKRRQYLRILLRDVLKVASLAETTAEISSLADVLIEHALQAAKNELQRRFGAAQHLDDGGRLADTPFAILSLGKLGGNELNYNSDIDLLYLYGDGEPVAEPTVSKHEYFIRLAQSVTDLLGRVTGEGPVFRIDLRLRPEGKEGELAVSLKHCLRYYSQVAQDWERQALIKARHTAGDAGLAGEFLRGVQAHVYRQELNFAAIKTALVAREKMHSKRRFASGVRDRGSLDVKLDTGGIRDIEFLVQCLQRTYGGVEPWLRSSGTLSALHKLHDKRHLSGKEFHDLSTGYEFLRRIEHFLQLRQGQQTHRLPEHPRELAILGRAVEDYLPAGKRVEDVTSVIRERMAAVAEIYTRVVYQQQGDSRDTATDQEFRLLASSAVPGQRSDEYMLQRLAGECPVIYELTHRRSLHAEARKNLLRFLSAAFTSSERYGVLLRNAGAVERAVALFEVSEYLTDVLVRHPEEITTLAHLPTDAARMKVGQLFEEALGIGTVAGDPVLTYVAGSGFSYHEKLSILRRHYREREFASGARDVLDLRDVYESLASTTVAAEEAIVAAFRMAGAPAGMAVLAVGRLGSREFDVLSDADLLFVAEEGRDRGALTKAAEMIVHALAAYTQEGMLFPVDPRLRPHGNQGDLVVSTKQLEAYFAQEAQAWEALSYTKLRSIVGDVQVAQRASAASELLFDRFARDSGFRVAVQEMRTKLENAGEQNFKTSPGGTYDIDFLASYLLVANRVGKKNGTLRDRLWRCVEAGHLAKEEAGILDHAAEFLRTAEHAVRLVTGRARRWLPARERVLERTQDLAAAILHRSFPHGLEAELCETMGQVRAIYTRVVG